MLFPTVSFAVFFAVVLPASWLLMPHRTWWKLFLIAASWFFYGCAGWGFVPLLAASTVVNHFLAFNIDRAEGPARRWWTMAAVAANLAGLGWFKYVGFLSTSTTSLLDHMGLGIHLPLPKVLLPAGISFFTFQAISYVVDVSRRKLHPVGLLDFAVYLSFFPHLLAGPIVRASEFLPQIRHRVDPRRVEASRALWLISRGLFKKVVIASYMSTHADALFGVPAQHAGVEALFGVYAYAIQIYADFSGYTDIAIGLALLLGVRFPQNFDSPYRSLSLQEFWRRWHMTLSRFLRDYLYIPLGGNRRGTRRTYLNLMATMLLGGLWHGAAWTFVAWGGLHGAGLAVERARLWHRSRALLARAAVGGAAPGAAGPPAAPAAVDSTTPDAIGSTAAAEPGATSGSALVTATRRAPTVGGRRIRRVLAWAVTFHVVCLGWVFFRATSFANAGQVLGRLFAGGRHVHLDVMVVAVVACSLAVQWFPARWSTGLQRTFVRWSIPAQALALAGGLVVIDAFGPAGVAPFIYFRF
ncbi:MAG TPA: MBOAT family protein [Acidimicrobiales bacterium]|jgi:D-alanyl-lipoteichoic acid acyltransferase DltB (MBOAT superfamily)